MGAQLRSGPPIASVGPPTAGAVRTVRALVLATSVVAIALVAHLLGRGHAPGPVGVAGGAALVFAAASLLSRRRLRPPVIIGFLALGQVLLHALFMVETGAHPMAGMGPGLAASVTPAMIMAHLAATAVSSVLLHRGEAALWLIWRFVSRRLLPSLRPYLVLPSAAPLLVPVRVDRTRTPLPHDADRRGPPCRVSS